MQAAAVAPVWRLVWLQHFRWRRCSSAPQVVPSPAHSDPPKTQRLFSATLMCTEAKRCGQSRNIPIYIYIHAYIGTYICLYTIYVCIPMVNVAMLANLWSAQAVLLNPEVIWFSCQCLIPQPCWCCSVFQLSPQVCPPTVHVSRVPGKTSSVSATVQVWIGPKITKIYNIQHIQHIPLWEWEWSSNFEASKEPDMWRNVQKQSK